MLKNLSLSAKIMSGLLLMVAFVAITGGIGYRGIGEVGEALHIVGDEEAPLVEMTNEMKRCLLESRLALEEFKGASAALATDNEEELDGLVSAYERSVAEFDIYNDAVRNGAMLDDGTVVIKTDNEELAALARQADDLHNSVFQTAAANLMRDGWKLLERKAEADAAMGAMEKAFDAVVAGADELETAIIDIVEEKKGEAANQEDLETLLGTWVPYVDCAMELKNSIAFARIFLEEVGQATDIAEIEAPEAEYRGTIEDFDKVVVALQEGGTVDGNKIFMVEDKKLLAKIEKFDQAHGRFQDAATMMLTQQRAMVLQAQRATEAMEALDGAGEEAAALLTRAEEMASEEMAAAKAEGDAAHRTAIMVMISVTAVAVVLGILIGVLLTRSITRPFKEIFKGLKSFSQAELKETASTFNRIIDGMSEGIAQVNDAAGQVSSASQSLAEGASEQASSLEETSSALEEMAAMTRTNASNSKEANDLATQAHTAANEGGATMTAINESSGKISKIIKVIEEIAFQTNLLALNAAVEAARAGEHGKGFAVVADEVRNLAQRAAGAAKDITALIENSVDKSREGVTAIKTIVEGVAKVAELLNGIAQASNEQAQGVEQVNTAVSQMDKVTQQNASGAEESASAAEELSAQAAATKGLVDELIVLVKGSDGRGGSGTGTATAELKKQTEHPHVKLGHPHKEPQPEPVGAGVPTGQEDKGKAQAESSGEFMSLKDDDLKEF